jgi:hypothetical protein
MLKRISYFWVCVIVTMLLIGGGALVQDEAVASELVFAATGQPATLTLGGEGVYLQIEFAAGETPWFAPFDENGNPFPDGNYKYELRTIPEVDQAAVEEAYRNGDEQRLAQIRRAEEAQVRVQSGSFEIVGGGLVLRERSRERRE